MSKQDSHIRQPCFWHFLRDKHFRERILRIPDAENVVLVDSRGFYVLEYCETPRVRKCNPRYGWEETHTSNFRGESECFEPDMTHHQGRDTVGFSYLTTKPNTFQERDRGHEEIKTFLP